MQMKNGNRNIEFRGSFRISSFVIKDVRNWKWVVREKKKKKTCSNSALTRSFFCAGVATHVRGYYREMQSTMRESLSSRVYMRRRLIDRFCHRFLLPAYRAISLTR